MSEILMSPFKKNHKQKYSVKSLLTQISDGAEFEYIYFWREDRNKKITTGCFSQWETSYFTVGDYGYNNAEQYMMAEKALLFNDQRVFMEIISAVRPREIKDLGRTVEPFDVNVWNKEKYRIVLNGNFYKFSQNPEMLDILLNTGNKVLVEASPFDPYWGIKMGQTEPNVENPYYWRGENLLGFALMEVRDVKRKIKM